MVLRTQQRCCARKLTAVADSVRPFPLHRRERAELSLFLAGLAAEAERGERRRALEPDIEPD